MEGYVRGIQSFQTRWRLERQCETRLQRTSPLRLWNTLQEWSASLGFHLETRQPSAPRWGRPRAGTCGPATDIHVWSHLSSTSIHDKFPINRIKIKLKLNFVKFCIKSNIPNYCVVWDVVAYIIETDHIMVEAIKIEIKLQTIIILIFHCGMRSSRIPRLNAGMKIPHGTGSVVAIAHIQNWNIIKFTSLGKLTSRVTWLPNRRFWN